MKITLDANNRKYIDLEVSVGEQTYNLKYFEKNTRQIKELRELIKNESTLMVSVDEKAEQQFFENLKGDEKAITTIKEFYEENGNLNEFINLCDESLGKQKSKLVSK